MTDFFPRAHRLFQSGNIFYFLSQHELISEQLSHRPEIWVRMIEQTDGQTDRQAYLSLKERGF